MPIPFDEDVDYFSFLALQRDADKEYYIKRYNVRLNKDKPENPTLSRIELDAQVQVPGLKGAVLDPKDFGFDFTDEYIAVSNQKVQDGRGAVVIYSFNELKFERLIMGSAGYLGVGQRVRMAKGTLPGGVTTNYIYFNSRIDKADAWSSFHIGQVSIMTTPPGLQPFVNPHAAAYQALRDAAEKEHADRQAAQLAREQAAKERAARAAIDQATANAMKKIIEEAAGGGRRL